MKTDMNTFADIEFQLQWQNHHGTHFESFFATKVNFWRDIIPKQLAAELMGKEIGDTVEISFDAGEILHSADPKKLFRIKHSQFESTFQRDKIIHPRQGRFYPKGMLKGVANVYRANMEPFRCAEVNDSEMLVDFNHPLAGTQPVVKATVLDVRSKPAEKGGGTCHDWMEMLIAGPGMQIRWNDQPTDFFSDNPFQRKDETPDGHFYQKPRFVNHIDTTAIAKISALYGQLLRSGDTVLDLMSSWTSHLPLHLKPGKMTGLGMNREELNKNEQLTDRVIHDLNQEPVLPFADESFDAVICSVSVEYLTAPVAIFREVGRILKPGGLFINTFSNRWFPSKVIAIWEQVQEFERMGLVSEYFLATEQFKRINTHSIRGLPRPEDDKYFGELRISDPVYAVWAYKR